MIQLDIPEQDWDAISEELDDPETDSRIRRKLIAIRMHGLGVPHSKIAGTLSISDDTVTNYVKLYRDDGLAAITNQVAASSPSSKRSSDPSLSPRWLRRAKERSESNPSRAFVCPIPKHGGS